MSSKNNRLEVVMKRVKDLIPYEHNPRSNEATALKLKKSIEAFGFKNPVIIDDNDVIVSGHARVKAALMLGMEEVPCLYASGLTEDEIKAFRIADNKTAEIAGWDYDKLCEELRDLMDANFDMVLTGFNEAEQFMYLQDDMLPEKPDRDMFREYTEEADNNILQAFTVMIICESEADKEYIRRLLHVTGTMKRMYFGHEIRAALEWTDEQ